METYNLTLTIYVEILSELAEHKLTLLTEHSREFTKHSIWQGI